MITNRQKELLISLIREHIKTAEPVGSEVLVSKYLKDVSSATIRNEMLELDKGGYLQKPHTSAGRIPTEKAYTIYVEEHTPSKKLSISHQQKLEAAMTGVPKEEKRERIKQLARGVADISGSFMLTAFADNDFYYTGLSNLFSQPELAEEGYVYNVSAVIDHLDERLKLLFSKVEAEVSVFVGSENPVDKHLSLLITKTDEGELLGILGPMRMKYHTNIALLEYSRELLK